MDKLQWKKWWRNERISKKEIWKPVLGYESKYLASNLGNIKYIGGYNKAKERILKQSIDILGYPTVRFFLGGKSIGIRTHRIIAETFIPRVQGKLYVNHKSNVKTDNRVENLEWCTPSENIKHARRILGWVNGEKQKNATILACSIQVFQYSKDGIFIRKFPSTAIASKITGIIRTAITNVCNGRAKTAGGYIWSHDFI